MCDKDKGVSRPRGLEFEREVDILRKRQEVLLVHTTRAMPKALWIHE